MAPEILDLIKSLIPVVSALAGTIVGVAGTVFVTHINKKSEERKHFASLSFNAGIENFKEALKIKDPMTPALEVYILNMWRFNERLQQEEFKNKDLIELICERDQLTVDLNNEYKKRKTALE